MSKQQIQSQDLDFNSPEFEAMVQTSLRNSIKVKDQTQTGAAYDLITDKIQSALTELNNKRFANAGLIADEVVDMLAVRN